MDQPTPPESLKQVLQFFTQRLEGNTNSDDLNSGESTSRGNILIHCAHGADRTGEVSALYVLLFKPESELNGRNVLDASLEMLNFIGYGHAPLFWKNDPKKDIIRIIYNAGRTREERLEYARNKYKICDFKNPSLNPNWAKYKNLECE